MLGVPHAEPVGVADIRRGRPCSRELRDELPRSVQGVARVGSERHVQPELLIAAPAALLAGDALDASHEVERRAERASLLVGQ